MSDAPQRFVNLARFDFELMLVTDVLVDATAASSEVRTFWRNAMRRRIEQFVQLGFGKMLFLANDMRRNAFAINRVRKEDRFAAFASDAFAAKGDIFNPEFQSSSTSFLCIFVLIYGERRGSGRGRLIKPDVRVFRFVAEFGRKLRISGVNVADIARQNRHVCAAINREREEQDFVKADSKSGEAAPDAPHNAVTRGGRVSFVLVDLRHRHRQFRPAKDSIGKAAPEFASWPVIVGRRVLNVGAKDSRESGDESDREESFHGV
jgi:hypothetical protein